MKQYDTIATGIVYSNEIVIDKSRFIGYAKHVDTVEEAVEFVGQIKKKHFDATHNCYGYICDDRAKFSDDGEPQGTAGMPIYECIRNKNLNRVCVVVTRYFGGIKLGAGGLVRAYNGSTAGVLAVAEVVSMRQCVRFDLTVGYTMLKQVQRLLEGKLIVENIVYDVDVTLQCLILQEMYDTITDIVIENTNGRAIVRQKEQLLYPYSI